MSSAIVRISKSSHQILQELSSRQGESMQAILNKAIEEYRRKQFFEEANAAYAALRKDPKAWKQEQEERALWDATLQDGLDPEEQWNEKGEGILHE